PLLRRAANELFGHKWSLPALDARIFLGEEGGVEEELLDLLPKPAGKIVRRLDTVGDARFRERHGDETIVAPTLALFSVLAQADHPDQSPGNDHSGINQGVDQHQRIERVAIVAFRSGNETEAIWIGDAERERLAVLE